MQDGKVINLAGVMGDLNTSCSINTKSVIIECAHFNPEEIIENQLNTILNQMLHINLKEV